MARVLWISDAGTSTGFSRVTHEIGERLVRDYGHEVHVLAIGYDAKFPIETPLKLYRAESGPVHHPLGFDRVTELLDLVRPEVVVTLEDAPQLLARLKSNAWDPEARLLREQPVLSYLPIDGYELPPAWLELLELVTVVALANHGRDQLRADIPVVYHGVDTEAFYPVSPERPITTSNGLVLRTKAECRMAFSIPPNAFVIGRVDTNSGRKDWPATWRTVEYVNGATNRPDIFAVFHTKLKQPGHGVDLEALISKGEGVYAVTGGGGWPVADLVALMNAFSATLSTSRGEAFGLGLAESLACEVPVVATRGSAIQEVVGPGGMLVDPEDAFWVNPYGVQMLLANTRKMAEYLLVLARNEEARQNLGRLGRQHVLTNFSWVEAARGINTQIEQLGSSARS